MNPAILFAIMGLFKPKESSIFDDRPDICLCLDHTYHAECDEDCTDCEEDDLF